MVKAIRSSIPAPPLSGVNRVSGPGAVDPFEPGLDVEVDRSIIQQVSPGSGELQKQHKDTHSGFGVICCSREQFNARSNFLSSLFYKKVTKSKLSNKRSPKVLLENQCNG